MICVLCFGWSPAHLPRLSVVREAKYVSLLMKLVHSFHFLCSGSCAGGSQSVQQNNICTVGSSGRDMTTLTQQTNIRQDRSDTTLTDQKCLGSDIPLYCILLFLIWILVRCINMSSDQSVEWPYIIFFQWVFPQEFAIPEREEAQSYGPNNPSSWACETVWKGFHQTGQKMH